MKKTVFLFSVLTMISGQTFGNNISEIKSSAPPGIITPVKSQADYQLLFLGNSHSAFNNLPGLVATLIETGLPGKSAISELAPGFKFLDERLNDGVTQELLESQNWTHVFLQAQKYSSSGLYFYPRRVPYNT